MHKQICRSIRASKGKVNAGIFLSGIQNIHNHHHPNTRTCNIWLQEMKIRWEYQDRDPINLFPLLLFPLPILLPAVPYQSRLQSVKDSKAYKSHAFLCFLICRLTDKWEKCSYFFVPVHKRESRSMQTCMAHTSASKHASPKSPQCFWKGYCKCHSKILPCSISDIRYWTYQHISISDE